MKRLEITGLRGIAACIIAYVFHYTILFQAMPQVNSCQTFIMGELARYGAYMSEIFFVLSGMLMYEKYHNRLSEEDLVPFFFSKMRKTFPLMICTACLTWILQRVGHWRFGYYILHADGGETRNSLKALLLSVTGLQTGWFSDNDVFAVNGPSWFISVWLVCQFIFFLITKYIKRDGLQNLGYGLMMVLGAVLMVTPFRLPLLYQCNGRGYFSFFAGIFLIQFFHILNERRRKVGCVISLAMLLAALCYAKNREISIFVLYVSVFLWPSLVFLCCNSSLLKKILSCKVMVILGSICMPIFLCNMFTDVLIRFVDLQLQLNIDYADPWVWVGHVIFSLLIAGVFHLIFEKRTFIKKRKTQDEKRETI